MLEPAAPLLEKTTQFPEIQFRAQLRDHYKRLLAIVRKQPFKRESQVIVVIHDSPQPLGEWLSGPVLRRAGNELRIVAGMKFQCIRLLLTAVQLLLRKLADGLVHAVAPAFGISPEDHQRVVNQLGEHLSAELAWRVDRLGGFQSPPASKDR